MQKHFGHKNNCVYAIEQKVKKVGEVDGIRARVVEGLC